MVDSFDDENWAFEEGDIVREELESHAPGGVGIGKTEYRINLKLVDEDGRRYYHVEAGDGSWHCYTAFTLVQNYKIIPEAEAEMWPKHDVEVLDGE